MSWHPLRTADGSYTLRGTSEACHSLEGAWSEAHATYVAGTRLAERATRGLRVLDVGTGPGWNVAAVLQACEPVAGARIELTTLELDRGVFEAGASCVALDESGHGTWLERARRVLARSLERDGAAVAWSSAGVALAGHVRFCLGDARESVLRLPRSEPFDAVFLDPFSPAREPELWTRAFLSEIRNRVAPGALLATYSASLAVRVALAEAGFLVGPGPRRERKVAGTRASVGVSMGFFDERTERKLARRRMRVSSASTRCTSGDPGDSFAPRLPEGR